ncbi:Surfeit locus protein 2 [Aphanomyces cochlioides]|nr:Surfeit locus protein 2 [Aphanomyces cochlioides]
MEVEAAVQALIDSSNGALEAISVENGQGEKVTRIKCSATGHEMPPKVDVITAHINSKRYKKATEWYSHDFSQYEPYIVAHRRKPKCLYCNVTGTVLNRIPAEVEKHMNGRKFQRLKEHVKFFDEDEIDKDGEEFDANKFEFLNRQLIGSDEESNEDDDDEDDDEDETSGKKSKKRKNKQDLEEVFYKDHSDEEGENDEEGDEQGDDDEKESDDESAKAPKFVKKTTKPTKGNKRPGGNQKRQKK